MPQALSGKTFGIPNGILLLGVAAAIWWVFLRKPKAATAPTAGTDQFGLGYAQGLQAGSPVQPPAATPPTGRIAGLPSPYEHPTAVTTRPPTGPGPLAWQFGSYPNAPGDTWVWRLTDQGKQEYMQKYGSNYSGDIQPGTAPIPPLGDYTVQWAVLPQGMTFPEYIAAGGRGGPALAFRKHHSGSRSSNLWHDAHPLIGGPVRYAHYVRVGGPRTAAAHHANINHVAAQAGVHPARVSMLNPVPTGLIRIA